MSMWKFENQIFKNWHELVQDLIDSELLTIDEAYTLNSVEIKGRAREYNYEELLDEVNGDGRDD